MKDILGASLMAIIIVYIIASINIEKINSYYEYTDLSNNKGTAKSCYQLKGGLFCELEDETVVQVKEFKVIKGW